LERKPDRSRQCAQNPEPVRTAGDNRALAKLFSRVFCLHIRLSVWSIVDVFQGGLWFVVGISRRHSGTALLCLSGFAAASRTALSSRSMCRYHDAAAARKPEKADLSLHVLKSLSLQTTIPLNSSTHKSKQEPIDRSSHNTQTKRRERTGTQMQIGEVTHKTHSTANRRG
jgi:hypothetical protein